MGGRLRPTAYHCDQASLATPTPHHPTVGALREAPVPQQRDLPRDHQPPIPAITPPRHTGESRYPGQGRGAGASPSVVVPAQLPSSFLRRQESRGASPDGAPPLPTPLGAIRDSVRPEALEGGHPAAAGPPPRPPTAHSGYHTLHRHTGESRYPVQGRGAGASPSVVVPAQPPSSFLRRQEPRGAESRGIPSPSGGRLGWGSVPPPPLASFPPRQKPTGAGDAGPERPFALSEIEASPEALEGGERGAAAPKCGAGRGRPTSNHDWPTRVPYSPPTHPTPTLPPPHCPHAAHARYPPRMQAAINNSNQEVATCTIGSDDRSPFGLQQQELVLAENTFLGFVAAMRHCSYKSECTRGSPAATAARDTTPLMVQSPINRSIQHVANPNRVVGAIEPSNRLPRIDDGAPFGSPTAGICFNTAERSRIRFVARMRHGSYESHHFFKKSAATAAPDPAATAAPENNSPVGAVPHPRHGGMRQPRPCVRKAVQRSRRRPCALAGRAHLHPSPATPVKEARALREQRVSRSPERALPRPARVAPQHRQQLGLRVRVLRHLNLGPEGRRRHLPLSRQHKRVGCLYQFRGQRRVLPSRPWPGPTRG